MTPRACVTSQHSVLAQAVEAGDLEKDDDRKTLLHIAVALRWSGKFGIPLREGRVLHAPSSVDPYHLVTGCKIVFSHIGQRNL